MSCTFDENTSELAAIERRESEAFVPGRTVVDVGSTGVGLVCGVDDDGVRIRFRTKDADDQECVSLVRWGGVVLRAKGGYEGEFGYLFAHYKSLGPAAASALRKFLLSDSSEWNRLQAVAFACFVDPDWFASSTEYEAFWERMMPFLEDLDCIRIFVNWKHSQSPSRRAAHEAMLEASEVKPIFRASAIALYAQYVSAWSDLVAAYDCLTRRGEIGHRDLMIVSLAIIKRTSLPLSSREDWMREKILCLRDDLLVMKIWQEGVTEEARASAFERLEKGVASA